MRNYDEGTIDAAIDRAVLDIMSADTRPAFRRRVLSRIEPGWRAANWFRSPMLATAALLMFGIAATLVYSLRDAEPPPSTVQVSAVPPVVPGPSPEVPQAQPVATPAAPQAAASRTPARATRRAEDVFGPRTGLVGAANVPLAAAPAARAEAAIDADAAGAPSSLSFGSELPPIVVAPIEIAPIGVSPARGPIR